MKENKRSKVSKYISDIIKEGSIFADVMLGNHYIEKGMIKRTPNKRKKSTHDTDYTVRSCPECGLSWERAKLSSKKGGKKTIYYQNFPKLGKRIELCDKCNEEEN